MSFVPLWFTRDFVVQPVKPKTHAGQEFFSFAYAAPVLTRLPDGSVNVRPGRPLDRLTPRQFAAAVGVDVKTVYDYIDREEIPARFISSRGPKMYSIESTAVLYCQYKWDALKAGLRPLPVEKWLAEKK